MWWSERVKDPARAPSLISGDSIGDDSTVDEDVKLFPNVTIYARSQIGKRVRIHSNSTIGADGFGYVFDAGIHRKVWQMGTTIIGDDVEIAASVTIDRGALGATSIGKGTKIDNMVHIGHNVQIGEHCLLCGQVGIAGSAKLGNYVVLAGQVGVAGHLKIGNRVTVGSEGRCDARYSRWRDVAGHARATGQAGQAHCHRHAEAAGPVEKSRHVGEKTFRV